MPKDSHGPQSSHEPAKPQFHVGNHQQVLPEVLPREMDLSFFWLTGILTAVTSPDEISRRKKKPKKEKRRVYKTRALVKSQRKAPTPEWEYSQTDTNAQGGGFGEIAKERIADGYIVYKVQRDNCLLTNGAK